MRIFALHQMYKLVWIRLCRFLDQECVAKLAKLSHVHKKTCCAHYWRFFTVGRQTKAHAGSKYLIAGWNFPTGSSKILLWNKCRLENFELKISNKKSLALLDRFDSVGTCQEGVERARQNLYLCVSAFGLRKKSAASLFMNICARCLFTSRYINARTRGTFLCLIIMGAARANKSDVTWSQKSAL